MSAITWENEERQNFSDMYYIANDIVKEGLRKVFKREWNTRYQMMFGAWDDTNLSGQQLFNLEKMRSRPNARFYQSQFLHGDTNRWSCVVLFDVLLYSKSIGRANLNSSIKHEVDNLRRIRITLAHSDSKLSNTDFDIMTTDVEKAFQVLGLPINGITQIKHSRMKMNVDKFVEMNVDRRQEKELICDDEVVMSSFNAKKELKKSIKHRAKIEKLRSTDDTNLTKIESALKFFVTNSTFLIGLGSKSTCVYVGVMQDDSEVAVKRTLIQTSEDAKRAIENEKRLMDLMKAETSPFIINCRHYFRDNEFMYLVFDLCEESLREYVNSQTIEHLRQHGGKMIKEILSGLKFLHDKGILHRDIKPSNILVDVDGHMKLSDFGISRVLDQDETTFYTEAKGTDGWVAAETIEAINKDELGHYKKKSDVQVAGMVAFYILTKGDHPFGPRLERMLNIDKGEPVNLNKLNDGDTRNFVSWLISHEIVARPFVDEALDHPFIKNAEYF